MDGDGVKRAAMGASSSPWGELLARYVRVFRAAWQARRTLDPPRREPLERQFLPAVLELQETPPAPLARAILWTLIAAFVVMLAWAVFGRVDTVAVAPGKLIADVRAQVVQPMETATVKRILVRDGQSVRQGDILIELDATAADAESAQTRDAWVAARLESARARALLNALEGDAAPRLPPLPDVDPARLASEQRLLSSQFEEYRGRMAAFEAELARRRAELATTRELAARLEQTVEIARRRAEDFQALMEKSFVSRHGFLEKEQARIEQERELAHQRLRAAELTSAIAQTAREQAAYAAQFRRTVVATLNEADKRAAGLAQEVVKAEQKRRLTRLTAPVDGTVQQLAVYTEGGVVTPAQPLLVIAPRDYRAEVEAWLPNKDVGFVKAGQRAEIKVETFPFTRYGTIPAQVTFVSNDAVNDEKRGLVFQTRLLLERSTLQVDGRTVQLTPGMAVTAEIKTGSRRVIEYFLSPLLQTANESLRER